MHLIFIFVFLFFLITPVYAQELDKSNLENLQSIVNEGAIKNSKISSVILEKITEREQAIKGGQIPIDKNVRVVIKLNQITESFLDELKSHGADVERQNNDRIQASIPYNKIEDIANLESVSFIRAPAIAYPDTVSEGAAVIQSNLVNNAGNTGQGVNIAIIDAGFDVNEPAIANNIVEAISYRSDGDITGGDPTHGTAVAGTLLDVAPDANLYLYNINTDADLLALVDFIINERDIDIISMSLGFFGVGYSDGSSVISQAVTDARNNGILWVNSAGNYAQRHWMGEFSDVSDGDGFHEFFSGDETIEITVGPKQWTTVFLMWDDPWGASANDYDMYLLKQLGANPNNLQLVWIAGNLQAGAHEPVEWFSFFDLSPGTYHIAILRDFGSPNVELELFSINHNFNQYIVPSSSLAIPADSADTFTIGATFWQDGQLESFSSRGPNKANVIKPDVTAPDGTSSVTYLQFFGTSASAPHAAGAAALVKTANPNADPDTIQTLLEQNTASNHPKNNNEGTGRIDVSFLLVPDIDNDGVHDEIDNCINLSNPGQEDDDNDQIGNLCDLLPNEPNKQCVNQTGAWDDDIWTPSGAVTSTDRLVIDNCQLTITNGLHVQFKATVDLNSGTSIINFGTVTTSVNSNVEIKDGAQWNENANSHTVFGMLNVQSGGIYNNNANGVTKSGNGGQFNVESGGIVNNSGTFVTNTGGTTTLSGEWNEQSGTTNDVFGTFNVASGGMYDNESGAVTKSRNGGNFNVQLEGTVNNQGKFITQAGGATTVYAGGTLNDSGEFFTHNTGTTTVSGEWNEQAGNTNHVFGTFNVSLGGVYDNEFDSITKARSGGNFNVQSGGTINNQGKFVTTAGSTTTISGEWNEQAGNTNEIFGIFNVASGGIYDNEVSSTTKTRNGGNFNLEFGGKYNNFGTHVTQSGGTTTIDDDYDNNSSAFTLNFGDMLLDCNGAFNDLGGIFKFNPIENICS